MMLIESNFNLVHWLTFTHSTQWEVLSLLLFPVIRIFHRDLAVPVQSTEQAEIWQLLTIQQQNIKSEQQESKQWKIIHFCGHYSEVFMQL